MASAATIEDLLCGGEARSIALTAPGRAPLSYGGLRDQVAAMGERLTRHRLGRGARIAIVLPNGPEMATAFLGVASGATAAPLNPAYKVEEMLFYLGDLDAQALLVLEGHENAAREAARQLAIPLIEISVDGGSPAGVFSFSPCGDWIAKQARSDALGAEPALLLHTSGTTSRPKLVPLSEANLCASAWNVQRTLRLEPTDRCLNPMPLFHIHGLVGALLSSLAAGASLACAPGFNAFRFLAWIEEIRPTWFTAVPSMHQAILQRAAGKEEIARAARLRLVRSSSSPLPPRVMAELEALFDAPAIEAYGMTEAAHQMTSNLLPPGVRKPGQVGPAQGPEVAVMGAGKLLAPGAVGEVVIRGANVMAGYLGNPTANEESFTEGWFHTGDQGRLDADGHLALTGRLKEIINRGGEKIGPREIDEVLLDHPAVAQAVTFALPHASLGEEVAAAVVLRPGTTASPQAIRGFAASRLADFKVPRKILILEQIPTGPTGKAQRIGLAKRLGLDGD